LAGQAKRPELLRLRWPAAAALTLAFSDRTLRLKSAGLAGAVDSAPLAMHPLARRAAFA
jgi:hypothetical protein